MLGRAPAALLLAAAGVCAVGKKIGPLNPPVKLCFDPLPSKCSPSSGGCTIGSLYKLQIMKAVVDILSVPLTDIGIDKSCEDAPAGDAECAHCYVGVRLKNGAETKKPDLENCKADPVPTCQALLDVGFQTDVQETPAPPPSASATLCLDPAKVCTTGTECDGAAFTTSLVSDALAADLGVPSNGTVGVAGACIADASCDGGCVADVNVTGPDAVVSKLAGCASNSSGCPQLDGIVKKPETPLPATPEPTTAGPVVDWHSVRFCLLPADANCSGFAAGTSCQVEPALGGALEAAAAADLTLAAGQVELRDDCKPSPTCGTGCQARLKVAGEPASEFFETCVDNPTLCPEMQKIGLVPVGLATPPPGSVTLSATDTATFTDNATAGNQSSGTGSVTGTVTTAFPGNASDTATVVTTPSQGGGGGNGTATTTSGAAAGVTGGLCFMIPEADCPGGLPCTVAAAYLDMIRAALAADFKTASVKVPQQCVKDALCPPKACMLNVEVPANTSLQLTECSTTPARCSNAESTGLVKDTSGAPDATVSLCFHHTQARCPFEAAHPDWCDHDNRTMTAMLAALIGDWPGIPADDIDLNPRCYVDEKVCAEPGSCRMGVTLPAPHAADLTMCAYDTSQCYRLESLGLVKRAAPEDDDDDGGNMLLFILVGVALLLSMLITVALFLSRRSSKSMSYEEFCEGDAVPRALEKQDQTAVEYYGGYNGTNDIILEEEMCETQLDPYKGVGSAGREAYARPDASLQSIASMRSPIGSPGSYPQRGMRAGSPSRMSISQISQATRTHGSMREGTGNFSMAAPMRSSTGRGALGNYGYHGSSMGGASMGLTQSTPSMSHARLATLAT